MDVQAKEDPKTTTVATVECWTTSKSVFAEVCGILLTFIVTILFFHRIEQCFMASKTDFDKINYIFIITLRATDVIPWSV